MYIISQWPKCSVICICIWTPCSMGHYKLQSYYVLNYNFVQFYITCVGDCMSAVWPLWRLSENAGIYSDWWCIPGTLMHLKWIFFLYYLHTISKDCLGCTVRKVQLLFKSLRCVTLGFGQFFGPCIVDIEHKVTNRCMYNCRCTDVSPADVYLYRCTSRCTDV